MKLEWYGLKKKDMDKGAYQIYAYVIALLQ